MASLGSEPSFETNIPDTRATRPYTVQQINFAALVDPAKNENLDHLLRLTVRI